MDYRLLFEPLKIGNLEIKNRFVMPAMDSFYTNKSHEFTKQACNYYGERAKGQFGLIITEYLCVSEEGLACDTQAGIYDDRFLPGLTMVAERVHKEGAKIFAQLHHAGRIQGPGTTDKAVVGAGCLQDINFPQQVHELTTEEIEELEEQFVRAAIRAKKAGFDGVEVHGAHGYLLAQFLSKSVNKRVDEYGGTLTKRARIVCEIIQKIKKACGEDYPVTVRTSGEENWYGGNSIEDAAAHAILFENAGADGIHISYGEAIESYYVNAGFNMDRVKKVKSVINIPVIGVGRINDPTLAYMAVKTKSMDFVALGRQSIADPHFPEKVKENRLDEIFTCTGCMQRCLYKNTFEEGAGTSCMMNPFSGREGQWVIEPVKQQRKIAVIGAGPAGLQAAWILAKRGDSVTVFEKNTTPGGQYRFAGMPAMKQELAGTIGTYMTLCKKFHVEMKFGVAADAETLTQGKYDEVIVAAGAIPVVPKIPGVDHENVCLANNLLDGSKMIARKKVMVLGAGLVGVETAELLSAYENDVTVVDMIETAAPLAPWRPRMSLLEHLEKQQVKFELKTKVKEILPDGIIAERDGQEMSLEGYDAIVLAFGSKSNRKLYDELKETKLQIHVIGDAAKAADAKKAIYDATRLALEL